MNGKITLFAIALALGLTLGIGVTMMFVSIAPTTVQAGEKP